MKLPLRAARAYAGMTQQAVAEALGFSRETIRAYEEYRSFPDSRTILKLLALYGLTFDQIRWDAPQGADR